MDDLKPEMKIKEALSRSYMNDILRKKEKHLLEREQRIQEEQIRLNDYNKAIEKEKEEELYRKQFISNMQNEEMKRYQDAQNIKKQQFQNERAITQNVSLHMQNEEYVNDFRNYMSKLSDKIDRNAQNYQNYTINNLQKQNYLKQINNNMNMNTPLPYVQQYKQPILKDIRETYGGIRREPTDVTDRSLLDKQSNKSYIDYREKHKEINDYNQYLINTIGKDKQNTMYERMKAEESRINYNKQHIDRIEYEAKMYENEKKRQYKEMLDEQRRKQVVTKLESENFTIDSANINPQHYKEVDCGVKKRVTNVGMLRSNSCADYRVRSPDPSFINRNKFVEVNPCKFDIVYIFM